MPIRYQHRKNIVRNSQVILRIPTVDISPIDPFDCFALFSKPFWASLARVFDLRVGHSVVRL
jgi:hypothetical protein